MLAFEIERPFKKTSLVYKLLALKDTKEDMMSEKLDSPLHEHIYLISTFFFITTSNFGDDAERFFFLAI